VVSEGCLNKACLDRAIWGEAVIDEVRRCRASRACGSSVEGCQGPIAREATTPAGLQYHQQCSAFVARCGLGPGKSHIAGPWGKSYSCAESATFRQEMRSELTSCFNLACDLGHVCTYGAINKAAETCGQ
jgi:hypothetical protein